jgi:16S rRNA (adenine1518-N6/adenine1519-N6)-dimethyltransferase
MEYIRAKKALGQHFLKDQNIARKIAESLVPGTFERALEIGPGMGILTKYLIEQPGFETWAIEIDRESVEYLQNNFEGFAPRLIAGDFLNYDLKAFTTAPFAVVGNFPYNISSQIFFKVLENRNQIPQVVCMIQKEVAQRLASPHKTKEYGILSVLVQAFYKVEYLFTVNESVFVPPPKVKSAVIRFTRNDREKLDCDEKLFFQVVKTAFNQRRKTLQNNLKPLGVVFPEDYPFAKLRVEQLSVADFETLTRDIQQLKMIKS